METSAFDKLFTTNVPHILEKIFFSLDFQSFKNCHQVCKAWNEVLSSECFRQKANKLLTENNQKLRCASEEGNADELTRILSRGMVDFNNEVRKQNCLDFNNYRCVTTPLKLASSYGHKDVVQLLLKAGADANEADKSGHTPLLEAARYGRKEVAQMLLDCGAEPNNADREGHTPIFHAAGPGNNWQLVKLLIESGAEVGKASKSGWTPLHRAVSFGNREVVKVLLDNGADPSKEAKDGLTPLSCVYNYLFWQDQECQDIIKMLKYAK